MKIKFQKHLLNVLFFSNAEVFHLKQSAHNPSSGLLAGLYLSVFEDKTGSNNKLYWGKKNYKMSLTWTDQESAITATQQ